MKKTFQLGLLYDDKAVIVVEKPAGLPAVPIPRSAVASALSILEDALGRRREKALIVHRIDRFTSGILLFAKTPADRDKMIKQFLAHTPIREYLAVVRGRLRAPEETLVHHLRKQGMVQKVRKKGEAETARAELRYKVERELEGATLVRVWLATGLQNQIRAQFAAIGHAVVGDRKYRPEEAAEKLIDRVALHAARLEFVHPRTGEKVAVTSKPPRDFRNLVKALSS